MRGLTMTNYEGTYSMDLVTCCIWAFTWILGVLALLLGYLVIMLWVALALHLAKKFYNYVLVFWL